MCKAPKIDTPEIKVAAPRILSNPFLDNARSDSALVDAMRTGRSALRIPLNTGLGVGFTGRNTATAAPIGFAPRGNSQVGNGAGIAINS